MQYNVGKVRDLERKAEKLTDDITGYKKELKSAVVLSPVLGTSGTFLAYQGSVDLPNVYACGVSKFLLAAGDSSLYANLGCWKLNEDAGGDQIQVLEQVFGFPMALGGILLLGAIIRDTIRFYRNKKKLEETQAKIEKTKTMPYLGFDPTQYPETYKHILQESEPAQPTEQSK